MSKGDVGLKYLLIQNCVSTCVESNVKTSDLVIKTCERLNLSIETFRVKYGRGVNTCEVYYDLLYVDVETQVNNKLYFVHTW